jgi:hypothetical protein
MTKKEMVEYLSNYSDDTIVKVDIGDRFVDIKTVLPQYILKGTGGKIATFII